MRSLPNKLLAAGAMVLLCGSLLALKAPSENKQYDYVSIVQQNQELHVSGNRHPFEKIKFKDQERSSFSDSSYGELFRKVNEFEAQGYELVESQVYGLDRSSFPYNYVLLRKPRS